MYLQVLGSAQDGGVPQFGCMCARCYMARQDPLRSRTPASLALVDNKSVFIIDATPDFGLQLDKLLTQLDDPNWSQSKPVAGIVISHAHYGHYLGLAALGLECSDAKRVPVFCSARMAKFITENKPFSYLVQRENIEVHVIEPEKELRLSPKLYLMPFVVPHRGEDTETFGFEIHGNKLALYISDLDEYTEREYERIRAADLAIIDGTFYSDKELLGRDMGAVKHPHIREVVDKLGAITNEIYFTHFNHTNAVLGPNIDLSQELLRRGFHLAYDGLIIEI